MDQSQLIMFTRWLARLLGLGLFLFWGAFFVEHTVDWFGHPLREMPPWHVTLRHTLHFLLLVGLLIAWKWEGIGGGMIVLLTVLFFVGVNAPQFIPITIVPGILFLACWCWSKQIQCKVL
jgi:hypothetical protein